ncbi:hypothetical protein BAUCODRAFT_269940 [Baudoinia panamericana UAMH 10762]|uniref:Uncharacterized protein n=1 Tax=Baudoinia panamericana (strain UAMH 10762) TaxID=717646 RepID=M2N2X2_BAUPA|nr:uncharacterized protein BAUCODRAFT_269940 [Baudoinia panamericana UAMH 10762]EMC93000.1 hypothetical protein BAUCODRAFT_269940 [Baudoinia panamericana UAMH 10762]
MYGWPICARSVLAWASISMCFHQACRETRQPVSLFCSGYRTLYAGHGRKLASLNSSRFAFPLLEYTMPRRDIEFKTCDNVKLRGWLCQPERAEGELPCLVMANGWTLSKEMGLNTLAEHFSSNLPICCLACDNPYFGA